MLLQKWEHLLRLSSSAMLCRYAQRVFLAGFRLNGTLLDEHLVDAHGAFVLAGVGSQRQREIRLTVVIEGRLKSC